MRKNILKKKIDKPDTAMKTFWRNNERFADLFNAVAFNGRQVINPDELTEMDTDVSGIIQFNDYNESLVRTRDIIKKFYNGIEFTIMPYGYGITDIPARNADFWNGFVRMSLLCFALRFGHVCFITANRPKARL